MSEVGRSTLEMSFDVAVGDRWWHGRGVYAQMTRPACAEPLRLECLLYTARDVLE